MDTYLAHLIERMALRGAPNTVFTEASLLTNLDYVAQLIEFIPTEWSKLKRAAAYHILGCISLYYERSPATPFLIDRIGYEIKNQELGVSLLSSLTLLNKWAELDIDPILSTTYHTNPKIRLEAISALRYTDSALAETRLLEILEANESEVDAETAFVCLQFLGRETTFDSLKNHLAKKSLMLNW